MSEVAFGSVVERHLTLDVKLGRGLWAFLAEDTTGLQAIVELATGVRAPEAGSVRVHGTPLYSSPRLRRSIGSLWRSESLLPAPSVEESVSLALTLLESRLGAKQCLASWGLAALAPRAPNTLTAKESRGVALALALSIEEPALLALYAPLDDTAIAPRVVAEALISRAATCPVILLATQSAQIATLEPQIAVVENGLLVSLTAPGNSEYPPWEDPEIAEAFPHQELVLVTTEPEELAQQLRESSAHLVMVSKNAVVLSGGPLAELSLVATRAGATATAPILSIHSRAPAIREVSRVLRAKHARAQGAEQAS